MARKVIVGMLVGFIAIAIASLGYKTGQYLARKDAAPAQAAQG